MSQYERLPELRLRDTHQRIAPKLTRKLSKDVHVAPDNTDIFRRLMQEKDLFKIDVLPQELGKFVEDLHSVMDIGIVVELGILTDWLQTEETKAALRERAPGLEGLGLRLSCEKLRRLLES